VYTDLSSFTRVATYIFGYWYFSTSSTRK
jgi:hypothetical protein